MCAALAKVLIASRYVNPKNIGSNSTVVTQARAIQENQRFNVEILTWPFYDDWAELVPSYECGTPITQHHGGLKYNIFNAPVRWNESANGNTLDAETWNKAVLYGVDLLTLLKPDVLHLHHRHGLWWLLESAQRLGIKTVYTNHDWGLICLRTIFRMGSGQLCDGGITPQKCASCIVSGRSATGRFFESAANNYLARPVLNKLTALVARMPLVNLRRLPDIVTQPALARTRIHQSRAHSVLAQLHALITPSKFGQDVFVNNGIRPERCHVLPWFSDHTQLVPLSDKTVGPFTLAYLGRISIEKNIGLIFDALLVLRHIEPLHLLIAGDYNNTYGTRLKRKYEKYVGIHSVEWLGHCDPPKVLTRAHAVIVLSSGIDNTPLSLIEALACGLSAVVTRTPVTEELIIDGVNGMLVELDDATSVATGLSRLLETHGTNTTRRLPLEKVYTLSEYTNKVEEVYLKVINT